MLRRMLYSQLVGTVLYGVDGVRVGQVSRVLVDEITGRPEWVAVSTGVLGARQRLVPVAAADLRLGGIRVPYPAAAVLAAPRFDPRDPAPNQRAEEELYRHYGMDSEPPPARLTGTNPDRHNDRDQDTDGDTDGDGGRVSTVPTRDTNPVPALAGWDPGMDPGRVRQLLEHAFSYPQQPRGPTLEAPTGESAVLSAESDAEREPRMTGGGHVDRGHRS